MLLALENSNDTTKEERQIALIMAAKDSLDQGTVDKKGYCSIERLTAVRDLVDSLIHRDMSFGMRMAIAEFTSSLLSSSSNLARLATHQMTAFLAIFAIEEHELSDEVGQEMSG